MKYLPPLTLKTDYFSEIEAEINEIFYRAIYQPLFAIIRKYKLELRNAASPQTPVTKAIKAGQIYIDDGKVHGKYSASISKALKAIGAKYNPISKTWALSFIPPDMLEAIAEAESVASYMQQEFMQILNPDKVSAAIAQENLTPAYFKSLGRMNDDFKRIASKVAIPPNLTPAAREVIAKAWGDNLDLYIKNWADNEIIELRKKVMSKVMRGNRAESMVKEISDSYGVSQRKAKFLARQETSLLMSKFQENRYKDMGIEEYKWSTAGDERTRPDHKILDGKIFKWDSPPVTNRKTGARNNAGEDYNCRCVAIPVFKGAP